MNKDSKLTLVALAVFLSALMSVVANAQITPNFVRPRNPDETPASKVVFVGDWLTTGWSATFPANWINISSTLTPEPYGTLAQQMTTALALKPSTIHIMIGSAYWDDDASYNLVTAELETDLTTAITQAQAAGVTVFVGIEPVQLTSYESLPQMDFEVYAIATKYGVPIINYNGAFSSATTPSPGMSLDYVQGGTAQGFNGISTPRDRHFSNHLPVLMAIL